MSMVVMVVVVVSNETRCQCGHELSVPMLS